jgi:CHAT domain-containing protein
VRSKNLSIIIFSCLLGVFLCVFNEMGIGQTLARQEYQSRLQETISESNTDSIRQLLKAQRGEAIRYIETLLDSSVIKKTRGNLDGGHADLNSAKSLAVVYAAIFGDDFYIKKVERYDHIADQALVTKSQIIDLKDQSKQDFYQGNFRAALEKYQQALKLAESTGNTDDKAALLGNIGAAHFYLGEFEAALDYYQKSLTLLEEIRDRRRIGNRLGNIAALYSDKSDYPTALDYYEKANRIRKELGDKRGLAADWNNMGLIYEEMGDYPKALTHYQEALEFNRIINNERSIAKNLANIANVHINLGDYLKALQTYEESMKIRKKLGDRKGEGNDLGNSGIAYQSLGDYEEAMRRYKAALIIHREIGFKEGEGYQLGRIATLEEAEGEYANAIKTYQQALEIHHEIGHLHGEADWLESLSEVYFAVGDHQLSLEKLQTAAKLHHRIGDRSGEASTLNKLGHIYLKLTEKDSAKSCFEKSLKMHRDLGEKWGECSALIDLAYLKIEDQELSNALDDLEEAKSLAEELRESRLQAWVFQQLGDLQRMNGNVEAARQAYENGLAISERFVDPELRWQLYYGYGKLWEEQGDDERAVYSYQAAVAIIEEMRSKALVGEFKAGIIHNRFEAYQALILTLVRLNRTEEAFEYVERARARNLLDLLRNMEIKGNDSLSREQLKKVQALQAKISTLTDQSSVETVTSKGTLRGSAEDAYQNSLQQAQREYERLLVDLKLRNPEYAAMIEAEPLSGSEIQELLDDDSVILEYFVTEDNILIFVVTKDLLGQITTAKGLNTLRGNITLFRGTAVRQMNQEKLSATYWIKPLQNLYEILIEPVQQAGYLTGKKHLIIVPQDVLNYLPFQALVAANQGDHHHFLVEDYNISYIPSASVLKFCQEKNTHKTDRLLLLAPKVSALPMSQKEVTEISQHFGKRSETYLDKNATESLLKQNGSYFDLLHFATTAQFNKINPMFSKLALAASELDDGNLEVHEIFNLNLQANLVVLSACQTALGSGYSEVLPKGEDLISLNRAFLFAGTPSVVASLWEIADPSTAVFMSRFYVNLKDNNKAVALAQTQKEMIRGDFLKNSKGKKSDYSHPYYWASFVLVGDWE